MSTSPVRMRLTFPLASRPRLHRSAARRFLKIFELRQANLLKRYERMVCRADQLAARRDAIARKIQALERAIAALKEYRD